MDDSDGFRETEEFDLEHDEDVVERWRHLKRNPNQTVNSVGEKAWWMVVYKCVVVRSAPSTESKVISRLGRGEPVFCLTLSDCWLQIDPARKPPPRHNDAASRKAAQSTGFPKPLQKSEEAWMMWDGQEKGLGLLLQPVAHLDRILHYRSKDVTLPREAVTWSMSEVDVFLGSSGFVKPGRESAMLRSTKRLMRAIRGGAMGLEYRVDENGRSGGVFGAVQVEKGMHVEVCPLLEVDAKLRENSAVLKRITVPMAVDKNRYSIVFGFGSVYTRSKTPNCNWSYKSDDEIVVWAREDVHFGRELTVDFSAPPQPLEHAGKAPSVWQPPVCRSTGKFKNAGYIIHGDSGIHGRGVFVTKDYSAGDLIESCPAVVLDEAAAEAMFNYRWGLDDGRDGFYTPLGLGSLYNHSEQPNARGRLDVGRCVLEFYAIADMHKGSEVFVSYGDMYFDEDFEGHRRSELLHIEAPQACGSADMQRLVELQRALIRAFALPAFQKELRKRAADQEQMMAKSRFGKDAKTVKTVHSLVLETQQPILERFGYPAGSAGSFQMQADLVGATKDMEGSAEAVRNMAYLNYLIQRFIPPPAEYWEILDLDLVVLGTQDDETPETLHVQAPKRAPCGFLRFMLSQRFSHDPRLSMYNEGAIKIVKQHGSTFSAYRDTDPMPSESPVFVSGVGNAWPKNSAAVGQGLNVEELLSLPDSTIKIFNEEPTNWQIVWMWLNNPDAQKKSTDFKSHDYKIAGTWNNFQATSMDWDGKRFVCFVIMGDNKWESFQLLKGGHWHLTLYPSVRDASPWVKHQLQGPDEKGHGKNWTIGYYPQDRGDPGTTYEVSLCPDDVGKAGKVTWRRLDERRVTKIKEDVQKSVDEAYAKLRDEELAECRRAAEESRKFECEDAARRRRKHAALSDDDTRLFDDDLLDVLEATDGGGLDPPDATF